MVASVEDDVLIDLIGNDHEVLSNGEVGKPREVVCREHLARRVVWCIEDQGAGPNRCGLPLVPIKFPDPGGHSFDERDIARLEGQRLQPVRGTSRDTAAAQ